MQGIRATSALPAKADIRLYCIKCSDGPLAAMHLWSAQPGSPKVSDPGQMERPMLEGARVERHLAAILAADVAGYSRLMGVDEEGTLAQLKDHRRDLVDPKISEHRGRIVKTTGDG